VADVSQDMALFTWQTFGPIASVTVVNDANQALTVAIIQTMACRPAS
jgi:acyl-CoA reductase-like NAD-dependent aldehyde dehydrogenase